MSKCMSHQGFNKIQPHQDVQRRSDLKHSDSQRASFTPEAPAPSINSPTESHLYLGAQINLPFTKACCVCSLFICNFLCVTVSVFNYVLLCFTPMAAVSALNIESNSIIAIYPQTLLLGVTEPYRSCTSQHAGLLLHFFDGLKYKLAA